MIHWGDLLKVQHVHLVQWSCVHFIHPMVSKIHLYSFFNSTAYNWLTHCMSFLIFQKISPPVSIFLLLTFKGYVFWFCIYCMLFIMADTIFLVSFLVNMKYLYTGLHHANKLLCLTLEPKSQRKCCSDSKNIQILNHLKQLATRG